MSKKLLTVRIAEDKLAKFRVYCDNQGLSMSEVINDFIDSNIDERIDNRQLSVIDNDRQQYRQNNISIDDLLEVKLDKLEHKDYLQDITISQLLDRVSALEKRQGEDYREISNNTDDINILIDQVAEVKYTLKENFNQPINIDKSIDKNIDNDRQHDRQVIDKQDSGNYENMTIPMIKAKLENLNISYKSKAPKKELLELLLNHDKTIQN